MSAVASFGNILNSLCAVRDDYNEHLKGVPQYEAFLLVEGSTQKVADTLQSVAPEIAADVVEALEAAKAKFRQHLTGVAEYRALLAIDKLINDVATDLGVQSAVPAVVLPEIAQAETELNVASQTVQVEPVETTPSVATRAAEAAEPVQVESQAAPQVDTAEHTAPPVLAAAPAETEAELTSAEAISRIQTALQSGEPPAEAGQLTAAEPPAELTTEAPAPGAVAPTEPAAFGHETEEAA
jgi:hypothetical protein